MAVWPSGLLWGYWPGVCNSSLTILTSFFVSALFFSWFGLVQILDLLQYLLRFFFLIFSPLWIFCAKCFYRLPAQYPYKMVKVKWYSPLPFLPIHTPWRTLISNKLSQLGRLSSTVLEELLLLSYIFNEIRSQGLCAQFVSSHLKVTRTVLSQKENNGIII